MSQSKNLFSDLFDFSFSKFIAPKLIGLLYSLLIFFAGLGMLFAIIGGLTLITQGQPLEGLVTLIVSILGSFLFVIAMRVSLETMIIGFLTAENTARTAENTEYLRQP